jgi:hypothetical protein
VNPKNISEDETEDESIEKLFGNLAENIFS